MTGQELHAKYIEVQAERGLEGTSWEEEGEVGGQGDWDALADFVDKEIESAEDVVRAEEQPSMEAGQRTDQ